MWFVFFLTTFHSYLLMTNQTTHEYLKKIWKTPPSNPFSYVNIMKNITAVIFRGNLPAHFDINVPIDLNLDTYSLSPSKEGFLQNNSNKALMEKIRTSGKNSPYIMAKHEDSLNYEKDESVIPEQI